MESSILKYPGLQKGQNSNTRGPAPELNFTDLRVSEHPHKVASISVLSPHSHQKETTQFCALRPCGDS